MLPTKINDDHGRSAKPYLFFLLPFSSFLLVSFLLLPLAASTHPLLGSAAAAAPPPCTATGEGAPLGAASARGGHMAGATRGSTGHGRANDTREGGGLGRGTM